MASVAADRGADVFGIDIEDDQRSRGVHLPERGCEAVMPFAEQPILCGVAAKRHIDRFVGFHVFKAVDLSKAQVIVAAVGLETFGIVEGQCEVMRQRVAVWKRSFEMKRPPLSVAFAIKVFRELFTELGQFDGFGLS